MRIRVDCSITEGERPKNFVSSLPYRLGFVLVGVLTLTTSVMWRLPAALAAAEKAVVVPSAYDPGAPRYPGGVRESKHLTMRDGVKIAIDVNLPEGLQDGQRLPTILWQTRYWRSMGMRWPFSWLLGEPRDYVREPVEEFVARGYAWVAVDARGSGASYGARPYPWSPDEVKDGGEIVDWIISQPWSDGKVGSLGWSYTGTTSEFLLVNNHPAVKAVAPRFALFDTYTDIAFPGGIHSYWFTENWQKFNSMLDRNAIREWGILPALIVKGTRPVDADKDGAMLRAAIMEHQANYNVHEQALGITYRDDVAPSALGTIDYFSPHSFLDRLNSSGAAVYSFTGWFDGAYQHSGIKRFMNLTTPRKLTIGPWDHSIEIKPWWPNGEKPEFDFDAEMLRYFDYHLKGIDNGVMEEKPIHYYTMVEEQWKSADTWPPSADVKEFYFSQGNALSLDKPASSEDSDTYKVDYTTGTDLKSRWVSLANTDMITIEYTGWNEKDKKLLCYTSSPLEEDTEVTGHPVVRLYVTSTPDDGNYLV